LNSCFLPSVEFVVTRRQTDNVCVRWNKKDHWRSQSNSKFSLTIQGCRLISLNQCDVVD
jgi:hypothetical protein